MSNETRHTVDPKFVTKRQGKDFVSYVGLVDVAHRAGLLGIATELVQRPTPENDMTAICYATVTLEGDPPRTFTGIGDANPRNVGGGIVPHIIRMAETRAKARALRDAVNVGMTAVEELGGDDRDDEPPAPRRIPARKQPPPPGPGVDEPILTAQIEMAWTAWEDGKGKDEALALLRRPWLRANAEQRALIEGEIRKLEERDAERAAPARSAG